MEQNDVIHRFVQDYSDDFDLVTTADGQCQNLLATLSITEGYFNCSDPGVVSTPKCDIHKRQQRFFWQTLRLIIRVIVAY